MVFLKEASITEYTGLGTTPAEEECVQVGPGYDQAKARAEARRFIDLLHELSPGAPEGARFKLEANPHDFGTYYDVVLLVPETEDGFAYGKLVDEFAPATWVPGPVPRFVARPKDGSCTVCHDLGGELAFFAHRGMEKAEWVCPGCEESLSSVDVEELALAQARAFEERVRGSAASEVA